MSTTLEGKRALVTGGTRGIGRAIVERLLAAGARVAFCGRSEADWAEEELRARGFTQAYATSCDVSIPEQVEELFRFADAKLGGLDILVNNAGIGIFKPTAELTIEDWRRTIDINLSGSFYCSRAALERMRPAGGGYIINLSSLAGKNPFAGGAAYNASKFGLNGFSEAMMLDHRQEEIRVTYIMPGSVDTNFSPRTGGKGADWKIAPEDVADMVLAVLRMPARTLVSRVEIRPSKPGK
jgi:NAD(P)-dependent dehydrogenase (short-subunit alcohol dehydrogenase family)